MILPVAGEVIEEGKEGVVMACERNTVVSAPMAGRVKNYPAKNRVLLVGEAANVRLSGVLPALENGVAVRQGMTLGTTTGERVGMEITEVNPLVFVGVP